MATSESQLAYVLITPAWNEKDFIERTIESVLTQTIRPLRWVIVSDGSTDGTDDIVKNYADRFDWIELLRQPDRTERHFAGKVHAFNAGYAKVKDLDFEIIGNLDADTSFEADYLGFLLDRFAENPQLGVAGTIFWEGNSICDYQFNSLEDVSGACQLFRRECFQAIGGYQPVKTGGIDLIAVLSARSKGWQTRTFTEKVFMHHRETGSGQRKNLLGKFRAGRNDYLLGCHPVWEAFRSIYHMKNRPYVVGGVLLLIGYLWTMLCGNKRTMPAELIELRQNDQMQRLWNIFLPSNL